MTCARSSASRSCHSITAHQRLTSLHELEDARELFGKILEVARAYLCDEVERDLFALPRRTRPVAPAAH